MSKECINRACLHHIPHECITTIRDIHKVPTATDSHPTRALEKGVDSTPSTPSKRSDDTGTGSHLTVQ